MAVCLSSYEEMCQAMTTETRQQCRISCLYKFDGNVSCPRAARHIAAAARGERVCLSRADCRCHAHHSWVASGDPPLRAARTRGMSGRRSPLWAAGTGPLLIQVGGWGDVTVIIALASLDLYVGLMPVDQG